MTERVSMGDSNAVVRSRAADEPPAQASELFEQYGPCPECGEETVTYSMEFEESDLACYTCGHWLDVHETTAARAGDDRERPDRSTAPGTFVDRVVSLVRSLF